jgi:radical SAM protein with 4Fe4S-binding SPASM domain
MQSVTPDLQLVAINLTRRCNLACAHCYLDAGDLRQPAPDELDTGEVCALLDDLAAHHPETLVVLTGGEPLLRRDLEDILRHGKRLGLSCVIGSNGALLSEHRVRSLKEAGAFGIGISLDSLDPDRHDAFRGQAGSWHKTLRGIEQCRRQGLDFQIHFSITDDNHHEIEAIIDFAAASGARVVNFFFIICTGRARSIGRISNEHYESSLRRLIASQQRHPELIIRPRCAPWFKRVAWQNDPQALLNHISGRDGDGCLAGTSYCRVGFDGSVTACPYIEQSVGNIRRQPLSRIWAEAEDFRRLRQTEPGGKCGRCEFRRLCGGCRARPLAIGGDLMDEDPACGYRPSGGPVIGTVDDDALSIGWDEDARQRLQRVPGFIRRMVRKRAEAYARDLGEPRVTLAHLQALTAARFGERMPWRRPGHGDGEP